MAFPPTTGVDFVADLRVSLTAKLERLLSRPIVARIVGTPSPGGDAAIDGAPDAFLAFSRAARALQSAPADTWHEDPEDGTCAVRIAIDYDDVWRGCEKEIREATAGTVDGAITFLTDAQKHLLEHSPREFLALVPSPETAELVSFETENVGGSVRVVGLTLAAAPESRAHIRHVAIVPNLVQLERQLDALTKVEAATDYGPLGPLRVLVGACDVSRLHVEPLPVELDAPIPPERLDEYQLECVRKAMATPHFAVIEGPPGSGKTTVISGIIRRALARGERVLVVSPTHVAVDNVVEKLLPAADETDRFEARSLPVRYAARTAKLSVKALDYWVGAKKQHRGAAIARRVQARLIECVPFAARLFAIEDTEAQGHAPISAALAGVDSVICGTPIGILSHEAVKNAEAGSFGLLIVDEVSKMTLSEFLAIAVKARRWVVVGDPAQLPPYNNGEENGTTLDDVVPSLVELACSVGAILERAKPATRHQEKIVVVSSDPGRAAAIIDAHLGAVMPGATPAVGRFGPGDVPGIVVCACSEVERACDELASSSRLPNGGSSRQVRILVERGLVVPRPAVASGARIVDPRDRAHTAVFEASFNVYHAQPWAVRSGQRLRFLGGRNGLEKCLPSSAALDLVAGRDADSAGAEGRDEIRAAIARRFALNTVSVYDWLTGIPTADFDTSPLREMAALSRGAMCEAVRPFVGTLKKQYRMHSSLSRVPRELFYFDEALFDGRPDEGPGCRVVLVQVDRDGEEGEWSTGEDERIAELIGRARAERTSNEPPSEVMVITPYREQEKRLGKALEPLGSVDVCTLDRCQGREADYVFISLVRSRATPFFDMPKRWNVALTRAKKGLFVVGNIDAYRREATDARREARGRASAAPGGAARPMMSLLARIVDGYDRQIRAGQ